MIKKTACIPARFSSSRFPGKPLNPLLKKPLIQHVYENIEGMHLFDSIIVLTDHHAIKEVVEGFGAFCLMTSAACATGTDRIAEAMEQIQGDLIINVQGDEPCIEREVVAQTLQLLEKGAEISTAIALIDEPEELFSASVVKCVKDFQGKALYFSRSPIPGNKQGCYNPAVNYFKHIGIYGFQRAVLQDLGTITASPLFESEDLEQLKWMEQGYSIYTTVVQSKSIGVDTPEDLRKVEQILWEQDTSLSPEGSAPL